MRTMGRRTGVTALAVLNFCLGLVGCLSTQDDFQPILQPNATSPATMRTAQAPPPPAFPSERPGGLYQPISGGAKMETASTPGHDDAPTVRQTGAQAPGKPVTTTANRYTSLADPGAVAAPLGAPDAGMTPPLAPGANPGPLAQGSPPHPMPSELIPTSHAPYRVAPPDLLLIDAIRIVPKGPYRLEPLEMLQVNVTDTLPSQPINGPFMISPEGTVSLGYNYGTVRVGGLSLEQGQQAIYNHLSNILKNPTVNLAVTQFRGLQQIAGQHLVRPDGTISLGTYGSVYVAGLTLGQVKCVLEKYLSEYLVNPQLSVDVLAYNSQKIYVIVDGGGYGQQIIPLPVTGNETVLDAISMIGGLAPVSSKKKIWVARPSPCQQNCNVILPVDWRAITMNGQTCTNYQLFAGDRVYIHANSLIQFDNYLTQFLTPIERVFGGVLLGTTTVRALQSNSSTTGGLFVP